MNPRHHKKFISHSHPPGKQVLIKARGVLGTIHGLFSSCL